MLSNLIFNNYVNNFCIQLTIVKFYSIKTSLYLPLLQKLTTNIY